MGNGSVESLTKYFVAIIHHSAQLHVKNLVKGVTGTHSAQPSVISPRISVQISASASAFVEGCHQMQSLERERVLQESREETLLQRLHILLESKSHFFTL